MLFTLKSMEDTMSPMTKDTITVIARSSNTGKSVVTSLVFASVRVSGQVRSQSFLQFNQVRRPLSQTIPILGFHSWDYLRGCYTQRKTSDGCSR